MSSKMDFLLTNDIDCVSISLSNVKKFNDVFRFDAEYFNQKALILDEVIRNKKHYILKDKFDVSKLAGFEFTKFFTKENMEADNQYIALTSKNIQRENLLLNSTIGISKNVADKYLIRSKLYAKDVVLSYTGEYRRSLVINDDNTYQLGPNVCRIRSIDKEGDPYFLSLYLNSLAGQTILDREKTLSAQPTVAMSRIREIPIPLFSEEYLRMIRICYEKMAFIRSKSKSLMKQAEMAVTKELHFDDLELENEVYTLKTLSESYSIFSRLDAEFYQEKYQKIIDKIKTNFATIKIGDAVDICDKNFIPTGDKQYKYLELANIDDDFHIVDCTFDYGDKLPTRARRLIRKNDVLVSTIQGSIETIAIADEQYDGAISTNGFFVCKCKMMKPELFALLLKNKYINMLLSQKCTGTILMNIDKDNFSSIELPVLDKKIEAELVALYNISSLFYTFSSEILNNLLRIVNDSIYSDENLSIKELSILDDKITKFLDEYDK